MKKIVLFFLIHLIKNHNSVTCGQVLLSDVGLECCMDMMKQKDIMILELFYGIEIASIDKNVWPGKQQNKRSQHLILGFNNCQ